MKNLLKPIILSLAFVLMLINQVAAQSPEAFKYQAVVRDANHAPLAWQAIGVRISILESSPSGTVIYQETHNVTTSAIGLINLNVGEGTVVSGKFDDINWESYAHFLQVEIDEYGGTNYYVLGTSKLLSVPYALFAKKAGSVDNVDDADADPTNEFQDLWLNGKDLSISQGNTVTLDVDDADADPTNEVQDLSLSGKDLSISQGNTVTLDVDDADADPTNELQDISLNGNDLSLSQGSTVTLPVPPVLTAGDGINIINNEIINAAPSLWELNNDLVFVDTNVVGIGVPDTGAFPSDARLYVDGNIRVANSADMFGIDEIVAFNGMRLAGDPTRQSDVLISHLGRVTFAEEVGVNQVLNFVDLNVRNQAGNGTVFQVEDTTGADLFEVGRDGNVGINQITNNVTLQVQNKTNGTNNIIFNVERADGSNVFQVQDDQDVVVTGDFSVTGNKNFILDHPLDPANKTLTHNAVESPAHVTYYDGTVQLDANGKAVVRLPDYFEALNRDFNYQLTCVGAFSQVFVAEEIQNNQFTIAGGQAGMKVSWQVSARRDDPWAHDHPYQAEEEKEASEKGKYFYPEGYGKGREDTIGINETNE